METLETYTFSSRGGGHSRYDLDKLLDGGIYRLKRGDDFDAKANIKSVRGYLGTQANKRGKTLHSQNEDDNTFVIQAVARTSKPKPAAKRRAKSPAKPKPAPAPAAAAA